MRNREPCLCGDPLCPRCFPRYYDERDPGDKDDERYERDKYEHSREDDREPS